MRKFCPNCGAALDDVAVFCGNCGTKLDAPAAPQQPVQEQPIPQQPVFQQPVFEQPIPQQPKKSKKGLVVAIVAIIAVLGIAAGLYFGGVFGGGYDKALDTYLKARMMYQCDDAEDLMPEEAWDTFEEENYMDSDDFEEYLDVQREYQVEELEYEYGSNLKFSYKVTKEKAISEGNLKKIGRALAEDYGIRASSVKKGYDLKLDVTLKGSEDSETSDFECAVVLIDDDWYVIGWEADGGDVYARFMP